MSDEAQDYEYDENGNKIVKRVTKIKVGIDENSIAEKVAENIEKSKLEEKALETFEKVKQAMNLKYNTTDFNDVQSPKELGEMTELCEKEAREKAYERANPHRVPSGKSTLKPSGNGETFDSPEALMDDLYNKGYPRGIVVNTPEGIEARKKIEKLLESMIYGKSWGQMKQNIRDGRHPLPESKTQYFSCPKCNSTITSYPCPYCGYNPREKKVSF